MDKLKAFFALVAAAGCKARGEFLAQFVQQEEMMYPEWVPYRDPSPAEKEYSFISSLHESMLIDYLVAMGMSSHDAMGTIFTRED